MKYFRKCLSKNQLIFSNDLHDHENDETLLTL